MLDAGYLNNLNKVLASLEDRIELTPLDRVTYFQAEASTAQTYSDEHRGFSRLHLRTRGVMDLKQTLPEIERQRTFHCIYTRDISRTGIGFLHADELFPGEECTLWLPQKELNITVVHCRRKTPRCYFVGAKFTRP